MIEITGPAAVQGSPEWLELRKNKRTASVAFTACRGSHADKVRLAKQLKGEASVFVNNAMQRGNDYEPEARASAEVLFGKFFTPKVFVLGNYLVSLDGIAADGDILEIKIPAHADSDLWKAAIRGEIPERYQYQLCQQIAVSGSSANAYLYVYLPEEQHGIPVLYQFSPAMWDEIRHGWDQFWVEYMGDSMPDDPERTDEEWELAAEEYRVALERKNQAESALETRKKKLIELAGDESAKGFGLRLTKVVKAGSIRYADYIKDYGIKADDLEPYRGKGSVSFSVTLGK